MSVTRVFAFSLGLLALIVSAWSPSAEAKSRPLFETEIARLVGGTGFGFCEFTRWGRRVSVRVRVAGMDYSSVGTAWIFIDGNNVGQLDGSIADAGGDARFDGAFKAPRLSEIKIDVRDHRISIHTIGNTPFDEIADETLIRELTTPAPHQIGTCTIAPDRTR